jgi:hypothetical protein
MEVYGRAGALGSVHPGEAGGWHCDRGAGGGLCVDRLALASFRLWSGLVWSGLVEVILKRRRWTEQEENRRCEIAFLQAWHWPL